MQEVSISLVLGRDRQTDGQTDRITNLR